MAKSDSRSSLNFLSDDSDIYDNAKENAILAADSPLRNPPTTSAVVEKTKHKKHSLSSRFLADKAKKTATTADSTKQKKCKKRLAKSLKKAKQKLTEKHLNLFPEGVSLQPLPKVSCTDNDNMESEDLIPGTPECQQGIINNVERSRFSAVNDLQAFIAKHKLKSNAAEELMRIFTRLVESFDMSAINKRIDTIEEKVGISATPPAQPVKTKTYASTAQQWSQGLLPTPKTTTIKPKITGPPKTLPPKQKTPQPVNVQKAAGKTDFVSLPTVLVVPKTSDPMEEVVKEKINIKPLLEANISPKALGIRIITCRVTSSNNILVTVQTQDMANKLMAAINQHANLQQICEARLPNKRDPQIIIYDIDHTNQNKSDEEAEFISRLRADNNLPPGNIRVLFRKPGRGARSHWVLSVSPQIFKVIKTEKRLHFGFGSKKFREHLEPMRCQNCLKFGHTKGNCKSQTACSKCCDNHPTKTCSKTNKVCRFCRECNQKQKNLVQNGPFSHFLKLSFLSKEHS
ncbi:uncharacterized protein LOC129956808 [Argiope bruennichi]|uniref:uncharacterized protein LOC129956808 n=1 Tax=Argiope bruennichi TaxID=94029 RepID=UPI0024947533|nr:uncharacterized protein LOC129956808 [Argiope bruennichi]